MKGSDFWYVDLPGGGVESGDSTMERPAGSFLVGDEDALDAVIDSILEANASALQKEQDELLADVEEELKQEETESAPIPIRHQLFHGMGPAMVGRLKKKGVTTVEHLCELGESGLQTLNISGLTPDKIEDWVARAKEILDKN